MTSSVDLVTCVAYPDITASDGLLAAALRARGALVRARPWNAPTAPSSPADYTVVRSSWDYHTDAAGYDRWLGEVASHSMLLNPLELIRWNLDKRYLLDLAAADLPIPRTAILDPVRRDLPAWVTEGAPIVLKPLVGASGVGVELVASTVVERRLTELDQSRETWMVQEFVTDVGGGEWALVFIDGECSHAFQRVPADGEFRVNSGYGGVVRPGKPGREVLELGERVLRALPVAPVYARIDLAVSETGPVVMEAEVNEPSLCLDLGDGAADRLAEAVLEAAST